jgi:hypothetical protein
MKLWIKKEKNHGRSYASVESSFVNLSVKVTEFSKIMKHAILNKVIGIWADAFKEA